ncbi:hypothetical protein ACSAZL_12175 [Methanosarcina sp. T3]|uniref:hypothetical protein n=1 Tax=Methanosarcina sp. T3 TaxID=3439062 RepID=UPI003F87986F
MTFTEILDKFKMKFGSLKVINSLDRTVSFYNELDDNFEESDLVNAGLIFPILAGLLFPTF